MDDSKNGIPKDVEKVQTSNYQRNSTHTLNDENPATQNVDSQGHYKHNLICFWMIGLCGGISDTVLSSATFDVIQRLDGISDNNLTESHNSVYTRDCIETSPAVFLLADIIPSLLLKFIILSPFFPFYTNANMILSSLLSIASFIIVAVAQHKWEAMMGIIFMSIGGDLSDITVITYLAKFIDRKNILVAYSSGYGFSGVIASFCYAALCDIGFKPKTILILTTCIPLAGLAAFFFIKESDSLSTTIPSKGESDSSTKEDSPTTLQEKWQYLPKLTKYFIPILINCLFEYIIGQTYDMLYVPGIWLTHADQYRWIQVISQFGSLFGRLFLSYVSVNEVWPLNLLLGGFMVYFVFEAIFAVSNIWVIFIFVFLVEFLSDYTIFIVYNRLTDETPEHYQVFAVCSVSIGISVGVIFAGGLTIPMHNLICKMSPMHLYNIFM